MIAQAKVDAARASVVWGSDSSSLPTHTRSAAEVPEILQFCLSHDTTLGKPWVRWPPWTWKARAEHENSTSRASIASRSSRSSWPRAVVVKAS